MRQAATAFLGAVMLIGCLIYSGYLAASSQQNCPAYQRPSLAALSLLDPKQTEVQLGEALCLRLNRSKFFARERTAIDRQDGLLKAAEAELAAARTAQAAAEAKVSSATTETKAAADRELQTAAAMTKVAEKRLSDAQAAV